MERMMIKGYQGKYLMTFNMSPMTTDRTPMKQSFDRSVVVNQWNTRGIGL